MRCTTSPEHVYFLISARAHPIDNAFIRMCGLVPIYMLGLGAPQSVKRHADRDAAHAGWFTVWGFFIHANMRWRLGPLEWLLSTPGFHHWHHTPSEPRDRNYASMLPWMDWIFGTHYLPRAMAVGLRHRDQAAPLGGRAIDLSAARAAQGAHCRSPREVNPG